MTTLKDAFDKYILLKTASMRSDATIRWYQAMLKPMLAELGQDCDVMHISEDSVLNYVASLRTRDSRYVDAPQKPMQEGGLSHDSIVAHIRAMKGFWSWAAKRYKIFNPMDDIKMPKQQKRKPKAIATSDFVKLFNAVNDDTCKCPERERAMLALLADSGVRRQGLLSLTTDIDLIRRKATVTEKGMKQRQISWTWYTSLLIEKWLNVRPTVDNDALIVSMNTGNPLQVSGVNQMLDRLKAKAGVNGRTNPHSFRHNFARQYLLSGGDLGTLSDIMGHESMDTTAKFYAIFTENELAALQDEHSPLLRMLAAS